MAEMHKDQEFLEYVVKSLVDSPEDVKVDRKVDEMGVLMTLEVNPVDMVDVYNAREKRVKEEIDQVRHELKLLAHDIAKFQQQVDITLMTEVVDPGQDGKYYVSFFQKLRAWIQLLRQQIKSAQTWATQLHSKNSKKRKHSKQPGLEFGAAQHEKTSTVQDMISNSERNTVYSGG